MKRKRGGRSGRSARIAANAARIAARRPGPDLDPVQAPELRRQRAERELRHPDQHRPPLGLARRIVEERGHPLRGLADPEAAPSRTRPAGTRGARERSAGSPPEGSPPSRRRASAPRGTAGDPPRRASPTVRRSNSSALSTRQACTYSRRLRVEPVVRQAGLGVDALHPRVDVVDAFGRGVGLRLRAERDRVGQHQGPLEPLPRVPLVEPGLARAGDHQRVRGLHEHRAGPAEQHGHLAMHPPRDAVGPEVAQVAPCQPSLSDVSGTGDARDRSGARARRVRRRGPRGGSCALEPPTYRYCAEVLRGASSPSSARITTGRSRPLNACTLVAEDGARLDGLGQAVAVDRPRAPQAALVLARRASAPRCPRAGPAPPRPGS